MALNARVAGLLDQAARRTREIEWGQFWPNPDSTDHEERTVCYRVKLVDKDEVLEDQVRISKNDHNNPMVQILNKIAGIHLSKNSLPDASFFLDNSLGRVLEL